MGMSEEEAAYVKQLEDGLTSMQNQTAQQSYPQATMFGGGQKQNLVEWQLDFSQELDGIEHLLRCDIIKRDPKTHNEYWITNPNKEFIVFNDQGVNDILREIRMFLNKNKVLSNYREDQISIRVRMIGHELRALIYNNSERYGIDNEYKQNNYGIIILTILSMIEDSYRRAINGEERRDLNSARIVQQNETPTVNNHYSSPVQMPGSKKSIYKPWTW